MDKMTIFIKDNELIVGDHAERTNMMPIYQEINYFLNMDLLNSPYAPEENEEF